MTVKEEPTASQRNEAIASIIFFGQILMVQFGGDLFRTIPLS